MSGYHIDRSSQSPDFTMGWFQGPGIILRTLEEEWRDNEQGESRIPAGTYMCERTIYHRHGYETFEVTNVPNRSRILFHPGNTEEDTQGCILLGLGIARFEVTDEETGERRHKMGVTNSRAAFRRFIEHFHGKDEFTLRITDPRWNV